MFSTTFINDLLLPATFIGFGATAIIDLWSFFLKKTFGVPSLDFALVGRWVGHMKHGVFRHTAISKSPQIAAEAIIGWTLHYVIGAIFAAGLLLLVGHHWLSSPTLLPAALFGLVTVIFPFLILQPGLGLGIAARKSPAPLVARVRSSTTHCLFGVGMYLCAYLYQYWAL
ncbi:DUF2938 domain-containing protein [Marinomonas epiphytica]